MSSAEFAHRVLKVKERPEEDFTSGVTYAYAILFLIFFYIKGVFCCCYSFEKPQLVAVIQMSTNTIFFYIQCTSSC